MKTHVHLSSSDVRAASGSDVPARPTSPGERAHTPGPCDQARDIARTVGREGAWLDLMRRFTPQQRRHLANLLAHKWTIQAIEIRGHYDGKCERIEAEKPHEEAVHELTYGKRANEAQIEREWAIAQKVKAHDGLVAQLRAARTTLLREGFDVSAIDTALATGAPMLNKEDRDLAAGFGDGGLGPVVSDKPLPCPFCGEVPKHQASRHGDDFYRHSRTTPCVLNGGSIGDPLVIWDDPEHIAAWNTRASTGEPQ